VENAEQRSEFEEYKVKTIFDKREDIILLEEAEAAYFARKAHFEQWHAERCANVHKALASALGPGFPYTDEVADAIMGSARLIRFVLEPFE